MGPYFLPDSQYLQFYQPTTNKPLTVNRIGNTLNMQCQPNCYKSWCCCWLFCRKYQKSTAFHPVDKMIMHKNLTGNGFFFCSVKSEIHLNTHRNGYTIYIIQLLWCWWNSFTNFMKYWNIYSPNDICFMENHLKIDAFHFPWIRSIRNTNYYFRKYNPIWNSQVVGFLSS